MAIKHKARLLISVEFQSEEVKSVYDDCSQISEWFRLLYCSFSLSSLNPPFMKSLPHYIASFESSSPSTLYSIFWVLVPSATFPGSLWVVVAKVALSRHLLHINVASKVAVMHLMRWCQPFLRYFQVFLIFPCPWSTFLSLNLLGRSL